MKGRVLIIAGSDSGGGAGIQADIKAVTMLDGYAMTAITALTVQNTLGVSDVHAAPIDIIQAQARAVLGDIGCDAVKTGMLGAVSVVEAVAGLLDEAAAPAVVDPVMVAKGGHSLLPRKAVDAVRTLMVPRAALVKGGHVEGETLIDVLLTPSGETLLEGPRIDTTSTHGTGCTLASACAAGIAQGLPLDAAVARAWAYVAEAIRRAPGYGKGHGPLNHAWPLED